MGSRLLSGKRTQNSEDPHEVAASLSQLSTSRSEPFPSSRNNQCHDNIPSRELNSIVSSAMAGFLALNGQRQEYHHKSADFSSPGSSNPDPSSNSDGQQHSTRHTTRMASPSVYMAEEINRCRSAGLSDRENAAALTLRDIKAGSRVTDVKANSELELQAK